VFTRNLSHKILNRKEVRKMKKLLALFLVVAFFASFTLVGCGTKEQAPPPPAKEEAKPAPEAAPAPEKAAEAPAPAPAPAPEKK
jgi:hypothetical protein